MSSITGGPPDEDGFAKAIEDAAALARLAQPKYMDERTFAMRATDTKVVICKATGRQMLGLLNSMLAMAAQQSFVLGKPIEIQENDKPFCRVEVRFHSAF